MSKHEKVNHSNQMNPNNDAYWETRGWDARPDGWESRVTRDETVNPRAGYQAIKCSNQPAPYPINFEKWLGETTTNSRCSYLDDDDE
jgi:hypothetical protein